MLALTQDATQTIERILSGPGIPDGAGLRIATAYPADGRAPTGLQVRLATAPDEHDDVIEDAGARIFVEALVTDFLDDKLLDVDRNGEQVRFAIMGQS